MDLPNENTLKIIQERKQYLLQKSDQHAAQNGYLLQEIKSLERVINLINLFNNNVPDALKKDIAAATENLDDDDGENDILYSYEQEISPNSKLDISFMQSKKNAQKYILMALKIYKHKLTKWAYQGKIRLTLPILEEIINKSHEYLKR